jgi:hypothetical protein
MLLPKLLPEDGTEQASDLIPLIPEIPGVTRRGFKSKYTFPMASLAEYVS